MSRQRLECAGRAKRRRRFRPPLTSNRARRSPSQSGVALRLPCSLHGFLTHLGLILSVALRPKAWFIPAQGNALGFRPVLFCRRPTACLIGSVGPMLSNGHCQATIPQHRESRFQRSEWSLADKPRALPWAGMNDAVGVSNRSASGSGFSGTASLTCAEVAGSARRARANNPCKRQPLATALQM